MWNFLRQTNPFKLAPMGGVMGYDWGVVIALAPSFGLNTGLVMGLLPYAEAGLLAGLAAVKHVSD